MKTLFLDLLWLRICSFKFGGSLVELSHVKLIAFYLLRHRGALRGFHASGTTGSCITLLPMNTLGGPSDIKWEVWEVLVTGLTTFLFLEFFDDYFYQGGFIALSGFHCGFSSSKLEYYESTNIDLVSSDHIVDDWLSWTCFSTDDSGLFGLRPNMILPFLRFL